MSLTIGSLAFYATPSTWILFLAILVIVLWYRRR